MRDECLIQVTCPDRAAAERIAEQVVAERLAACATLIPGAVSFFRWQGVMQRAEECVLHLKSRTARVQPCIDRIVALHPDALPGITVVPLSGGHQPFLDWIVAETRRE